jgi:hypothetical protein
MLASQMVFNSTSGTYLPACGGGGTPDGTKNDFAVTVQLSGSDLKLGYAGSLASPAVSRVLASNASAFTIRYLDVNYAVTGSAAALRFVELSLTVQPPGGPATRTLAVVALRNN